MPGVGIIITVVVSYLATLLFMLIVVKPMFIIYNRRTTKRPITLRDLWRIYRYGVLSDYVVSGYLTAIPLIMLWVAYNVPSMPIGTFLTVYTAIMALVVSLITVSDTALYNFWHFKIDSSVLSYLTHPKEAFASVSAGYIIVGITAIAAVGALYFYALEGVYSLCSPYWEPRGGGWVYYTVGNLLFTLTLVCLAVIIRGLRLRPNNPTIVIHSEESFFNHAALNAIFSFSYSIGNADPYKDKYRIFDDAEEVAREVARMYPRAGKPSVEFLRNKRPNILVIVWESLHARFVEAVGGKPGVTPALNALAREGVVFTNMQCGSFLTDRGQACIFSGLPGQPSTSIGKYTQKLPHLPALPRRLKELGYTTEVVHGGDLSVRQIADYFHASGHDRLVGINDFPRSAPRCRWGVHDEATFRYVFDETQRLTAEGKPWLISMLTLSSHENFAVPEHILDDRMDNAFAYTDRHLGLLIEKLRNSPAWDNTLVVICADHGVHFSTDYGTPLAPEEFPHIACVLTGGAVSGHMSIDKLVSQTDLAATLLGQMGLDHSDFPFSRDVLADTYTEPIAFQANYRTATLRDNRGCTVFNTDTLDATAGADPERELRFKQILQQLYEYISKL